MLVSLINFVFCKVSSVLFLLHNCVFLCTWLIFASEYYMFDSLSLVTFVICMLASLIIIFITFCVIYFIIAYIKPWMHKFLQIASLLSAKYLKHDVCLFHSGYSFDVREVLFFQCLFLTFLSLYLLVDRWHWMRLNRM